MQAQIVGLSLGRMQRRSEDDGRPLKYDVPYGQIEAFSPPPARNFSIQSASRLADSLIVKPFLTKIIKLQRCITAKCSQLASISTNPLDEVRIARILAIGESCVCCQQEYKVGFRTTMNMEPQVTLETKPLLFRMLRATVNKTVRKSCFFTPFAA